MATSNTTGWNNKYILVNNSCILVNNSGSEHVLLKKFDQLMQYYKRKILIKKFYEKCGLEASFRPFVC